VGRSNLTGPAESHFLNFVSLNEAKRKPQRERHPLAFDLMGLDRKGRDREDFMQAIKEQASMSTGNSFLSDKLTPEKQILLNQFLESLANGGQGKEFDLSKPPVVAYSHKAFPQVVYHHETGHVVEVANPKQLEAAKKRGFQTKPSPNHDYSQVRNGIAAVKPAAVQREAQLSAEDFTDESVEGEEAEATDEAVNEAIEAPSRRRR
jgi:hypothetical protein